MRAAKMEMRIAHTALRPPVDAPKRIPDDPLKHPATIKCAYTQALRRNLSYREIRSLISAIAAIEPGFSKEPLFAQKSTSGLASMASRLGIRLKAAPLRGDGMGLFGFYLPPRPAERRSAGLSGVVPKRPMIFLNTAHHPLAVCGAFHHELSHHFTKRILQRSSRQVGRFEANFEEHLDDPIELVADIAVSLYFYPDKVAAKLFAARSGSDRPDEGVEMGVRTLSQIFDFLKYSYGFDLGIILRQRGKSHYLLGAIHYMKLRRALLTEYGV
jgi:hypothetical protein